MKRIIVLLMILFNCSLCVSANSAQNYSFRLFGEAENWSFNAINAQAAHNILCYGNDVKIGVIDPGISLNEYNNDCVTEGYNFITNSTDTTDNIGHGTLVSNIICAKSSDAYSKGIAPKVKIIPLKCFEKGYYPDVEIIAKAIKAAVDNYECKILNLSFGVSETSVELENAINYALRKNVILVAPVGNDGNSDVYYPAGCDGVIGVGAVNKYLRRTIISQTNHTVDIVAPGEGLYVKSIDGYNLNLGTSFSAPHITAAAAIALSVNSRLTNTEFSEIIEMTAKDLGKQGRDDEYGYGLIDINAMVNTIISNRDACIINRKNDKGIFRTYETR